MAKRRLFLSLGNEGQKKLSKFFKDEKIDIISKDAQWLLCSEDEIIWVVGRRADERFKVTDSKRTILKFELHT
ncbi:tRNA lysidine(34) synthetase TilS C-terminal domain-containing protein [Maribacter halichondriae]|uniref:tRNA lysidine(34) synthetase TilS C-terminal domain-containing protein n=1 Tax=Maribacter halichondriae TaxID=2980554 RepID=UPI0030760669